MAKPSKSPATRRSPADGQPLVDVASALARALRHRQPRLPRRGYLPRPLGEPVPHASGVHPALFLRRRSARSAFGAGILASLPAVWHDVGYLVGWSAILIGLAGVVLHLESHFFYERTLAASPTPRRSPLRSPTPAWASCWS